MADQYGMNIKVLDPMNPKYTSTAYRAQDHSYISRLYSLDNRLKRKEHVLFHRSPAYEELMKLRDEELHDDHRSGKKKDFDELVKKIQAKKKKQERLNKKGPTVDEIYKHYKKIADFHEYMDERQNISVYPLLAESSDSEDEKNEKDCEKFVEEKRHEKYKRKR